MASLPASETDAAASAALATHEAKTTSVHGIADTGDLVTAEQLAEALDGVEGGALPKVEEWQQATLLNSWADYVEPEFPTKPTAFYKDPFGVVRVRGWVGGGTINGNSSGTVFLLPAGYRPAGVEGFVLPASGTNKVYIYPSGEVRCTSGNNAFMALAGIAFRAA